MPLHLYVVGSALLMPTAPNAAPHSHGQSPRLGSLRISPTSHSAALSTPQLAHSGQHKSAQLDSAVVAVENKPREVALPKQPQSDARQQEMQLAIKQEEKAETQAERTVTVPSLDSDKAAYHKVHETSQAAAPPSLLDKMTWFGWLPQN